MEIRLIRFQDWNSHTSAWDDECTGEVTKCSRSGVGAVSGMEGFSGLLEHPSPLAGFSKSFVRTGWDCREGVFNGLLPVLNPNGFMTGWWWVVTTWRKTPRKSKREVSSQLLEHELSQQAVIVIHPCYWSRWVMRNDRLGNAGIKFTDPWIKFMDCAKSQNQSMSTVVWGFCLSAFFDFFTLTQNLFSETFFLLFCFCFFFSGLRRHTCMCVCLTTFREFLRQSSCDTW